MTENISSAEAVKIQSIHIVLPPSRSAVFMLWALWRVDPREMQCRANETVAIIVVLYVFDFPHNNTEEIST